MEKKTNVSSMECFVGFSTELQPKLKTNGEQDKANPLNGNWLSLCVCVFSALNQSDINADVSEGVFFLQRPKIV